MENLFDPSFLFVLSGEAISLLSFVVQIICILLMMRFFGISGIFVYMAIAVVLGNIQVMKFGVFDIYPQGVALGTITFSTAFLCTDILNEYYGKIVAKKAIYLSFMAMVIGFVLMFLTLIHEPVSGDVGHQAMLYLFSPGYRLLAASLIAYFSSQMIDVLLYSALKKLTPSKFIWIRAFLSLVVASFFDNLIFSVFAWRIFSPNPVSMEVLMYSYVLSGYGLRLCVAIFGIPVIYCAKYFLPKKEV